MQRSKELRAEMTPQERALWARLRGNLLKGLHFRRQQVIDGFLADFYCHAAGLVIELDGLIHLRQVDYDRERDKAIAAHNLLVMRVTNDAIDQQLDQVLQRMPDQGGNGDFSLMLLQARQYFRIWLRAQGH